LTKAIADDAAFNSLSRDHQLANEKHALAKVLSTPSLGITPRLSVLSPVAYHLSTPSLGITYF